MSDLLEGTDKRPSPALRWHISASRWVCSNPGAAAITTVCLAVYLLYSLSEYSQYLSNGYDLGIFDQVVRDYAHFRAPVSAVKAPGYNVLGDHFSPVMALLAPLYWIWDNPVMLLVAQAALIASSVPVVYRIALRHSDRTVALFVAAFYGLGWPLQAMANYDVHEVAFAVPLLACALDAMDRLDNPRLILWSSLLLLVKEDMGIVVATIGIVAAIRGADRRALTLWARLRRPSPAALLLLIGGLYVYAITTKIVIPEFAPGGHFAYWQYNEIGPDLPSALLNLATRPWHAVAVFFSPFAKSLTLIMLFIPLALIPLRSPYIIVVLPLLAERFFNSRPQLWGPQFHYSALPWVVLVIAFIDGADRWRVFQRAARRSRSRTALLTWMIVWQFFATWAMSATEEASSPGRGLIFRLSHWNGRAVNNRVQAVAALPARVCVEADNGLIPHLTERNFVTLPGAPGSHPDYIVYDLSHMWVGPAQTGQPGIPGLVSTKAAAQTEKSGDYKLVESLGSIRVFRAKDYRGPSPECGPLGIGRH